MEMATLRRSKRTAGGGERVGCVGDGSNSDSCCNGNGGGLEDEREGAGGAPSAADDDEIEGAGDGVTTAAANRRKATAMEISGRGVATSAKETPLSTTVVELQVLQSRAGSRKTTPEPRCKL
jgi:hypothetical protein